MAPCYGLEPGVGILKSSYAALPPMRRTPMQPNCSSRFLLTQEGFDPWSKIGTYAAVVGPEIEEDMPAFLHWNSGPVMMNLPMQT